MSVLGAIYELEQGFLAGRVVDVVYSHLDQPLRPEVEYEGRRYPLALVDPVSNAHRLRPPRYLGEPSLSPVSFDPSASTTPDACDVDEEDLDAIF